MKINFGKDEIKFSFRKDNFLDNPLKELSLDINDESYKKYTDYFFNGPANFYEVLKNEFEKFMNQNNPTKKSYYDNINIIEANGHDICNYLARYGMANFQIQSVLKLEGKLDFDKLLKAVRLSLVKEPVFGCKFVKANPPYWKRIKNIDTVKLCSFEETANLDFAIKRFLESNLDMDNDPMVKVRLIRYEDNDTLCVKTNHTCCDGAGTKEYIKILAEIYSNLVTNENYKVEPSFRGRLDQERLIGELGIKEPQIEWNPYLDAPKTMWSFPWKQGRSNDFGIAMVNLPNGHLNFLKGYAKGKGATINDLILTAYYRAMFEISKPIYGIPMDISTTIDLRRYLPDKKAEAIRNLSGGFLTSIPRIKDEPFEGTLNRVMESVNKIKAGLPGKQNAIGAECVEKKNFMQLNDYFKLIEMASKFSISNINVCSPTLSNLGIISKAPLKFADKKVTDAYVVPPAIRAPGFLLLVSTYNEKITLSTGYYKASINKKDIEKLLKKIRDELTLNFT